MGTAFACRRGETGSDRQNTCDDRCVLGDTPREVGGARHYASLCVAINLAVLVLGTQILDFIASYAARVHIGRKYLASGYGKPC